MYEVFDAAHTGTKRSEVNPEDLQTISDTTYEDANGDISQDAVISALVAAGYKPGGFVDVAEEHVDRYVSAMRSMGVNCAVGRLEQNEWDGGLKRDIVISRAEIPEAVLTSAEEEEDVAEDYGHFLGYAEDDVKAYIEHGSGMNVIHYEDGEVSGYDVETEGDHVFFPEFIAETRGLPDHDIAVTDDYVFHMIRDTPESIECALETGRQRKHVLEAIRDAYGVEFLRE